MILLEESSHLGFKVPFAMMLFLRLDVLDQRTSIRRAYRKGTIPTLPGELGYTLLLYPLRGVGLQVRQQSGQALRRMQPHCEMDMVRRAANAKAVTLPVSRYRSQIRMKTVTNGVVQKRPTALRTEHDVNQHETQRLGHTADYKSGLQPSLVASRLPGATPQAGMSRAFSADFEPVFSAPGRGS